MYEIKTLDLKGLAPEERTPYEKLIDPAHLDAVKYPDNRTVAIAIFDQGQPKGLGLGKAIQYAEIPLSHGAPVTIFDGIVLSLKIPNDAPNAILSQLFENMEKELKKKYCPLLITRISSSHPQYANIDKVLRERGWQGPKSYLMHYHFTSQTFHPEWLIKAMEMPYAEGVTEFLWKELTQKEKDKLLEMEKKKAFPQGVNPFAAYGGPVEPLNSLGLRYKGEVIAWVITKRIAPDTIRYSALYINPAHHLKGAAIKLLASAIALQKKSPVPKGYFELEPNSVQSSWLHFVEQKLIPSAESIEEIKQYWKPS